LASSISTDSSTRSKTVARTTTAPLCEGEFDADEGVAICPRHGARFDTRSGRPLTLPATEPVATYAVLVREGQIVVELSSPKIAE